ncbi:MAG: phosphomannomutase/phosphoglucomutase [Gammaproteobacteria bacterium]|nr:MAG: phosphomannomutase/phosphoglucomutase [Gammaproteobacteria bacterium]
MRNLAIKFGSSPIVLLTLIVSCVAVFAGFIWQYQQINSQQQQQQTLIHQQTAKMISGAVAARVQIWNKQVVAIAKSPQLPSILVGNDPDLIDSQQQTLSHLIPEAYKVCLIAADVDEPNANACIPITFATLNSLRQAKKEGSAAMAVMQIGSDDAHLLLANKITNNLDQVVGVLVVALKLDVVKALLLNSYGSNGYIELQQGSGNGVTILASQGDAKWKKGMASFQQAIGNSHWHIVYWSGKPVTGAPFLPVSSIVVLVIFLMWFLRGLWQRYLIRCDVGTLRGQLTDFKNGTLKPKYHLSFNALQDVVDDIQTLGREEVATTPRKKATADQINKKLEQNKKENPAELDMLEEHIDIASSIFKAYDIRGIVGQTLNEQVMTILGQAIGSEAQEQGQTRLTIGRDGRQSSPKLTDALIEGILASGCGVVNIGMVPTPVLYFACHQLDTQSGVMVTGSHNPADYNGLKIVIAGKSLAGDDIQALYSRIEKGNLFVGQASKHEVDVVDDYIQRIRSDVVLPRSISVVVDCGNGVAGVVVPKLLTALGCNVTELYCDVDGSFPNHHPNPSDPQNLHDLATVVQQNGAELGLAFDGDGDRIGVVDANGRPIWPDRLMSLFAQDVLSRQPGSVVIYDVKSTNLLGDAIMRAGGEALMWKSGHSVIKNKMQEMNAQLAGEMSGHIFFKERWYGFDDAQYTACRLLELLANDPLERTPTEIFSAIPDRINTPELVVEMAEGESQNFMRKLTAEAQFSGAEITTMDGIRADYPNGWGLVRASNTVPGLTLRFEADTEETMQQIQQQFKQQMLKIKPTLELTFLTLEK